MADLGDFDDLDDDIQELEEEYGVGSGTEEKETDPEQDTEDSGFEEYEVESTRSGGLGVISAAQGLSIGDETRLTAYITTGNRRDIRIGRYLTVPYPDDEKLFAKVSGLEYAQEFVTDDANEIHARRAMKNRGLDEADYKFLAKLEPVAVLEGGQRRMPDRIPRPNAVVEKARNKEEIKTGLNLPSEGIFIGHLAVGGKKVDTGGSPPTIDYRLRNDYSDADPLIFRHVLIAGGTGSGKSHTAKNVLRQFLAEDVRYRVDEETSSEDPNRRPSIVVFDPQNEYSQMHDDNPDITGEDERTLESEGVKHGGYDNTKTFVPKVDGYTYDPTNHGAPQVEFSVPFEMVKDNKWLLASGGLNENQYRGLSKLIEDYFEGNDDPTYAGFSDFVDDIGRKEVYHEEGKIHEATYNSLISRVVDNSVFDRVFDTDAQPITSDRMVKELVKDGRLSVVPTYHITNSRMEEVVVLALASLIVDDKLATGGREVIKNTPLILAMDEAHNFLAEAETTQGRRIKGKFGEAAKQGRKERLGLFLITQDPGDIADPIFKQINTKIVLNLGDERAIKSVNIPKELEDKVPYMEKGEMVVYSPDNSESVEIKGLEKCVTKHS